MISGLLLPRLVHLVLPFHLFQFHLSCGGCQNSTRLQMVKEDSNTAAQPRAPGQTLPSSSATHETVLAFPLQRL